MIARRSGGVVRSAPLAALAAFALFAAALPFGCAPSAGGPGGVGQTGGTSAGVSGNAGAGGGPGTTGVGGVGGTASGAAGTGLPPVTGQGGVGLEGGATGGTGGPGPTGAAGTTGTAGTTGSAGRAGGAGSAGSAGSAGTTGSGAAGAPGMPSLIGDVSFSTPSQSFRSELSVGMTTAVAGAQIRYTTDGTVPTASSTVYGGTPLVLTGTTQLRALPFVGGAAAGRISTGLYIARAFDATSNLPIVIVDGYGKGPSTNKNLYLDAAIMIFEPAGQSASLAALPTLASRAGYHLRGQSSANFPQKPFRIELWDNANTDAKYPVLGMPADADWALIPPYYDRALIRNPFVYELGRDLGLQAPRTRFVEVYINTAARPVAATDYQGIYWFTETIENSAGRTNLKQLDATHTTLPAISGGYIFKFDQAAAEEPKLACTGSNPISGGFGTGGRGGGTCWVDLELVDPDPLGAEQRSWITGYIQTFHNTLHTTPIGDYGAHIDVPSFVDYLLINELTRNVDAYVRSAFYFKERNGKLQAGPLWDYNFSLAVGGMGSVAPAPAMNGWQFQGTRNVNNWYPKLTADPAFMNLVKARFRELRGTFLSQASINERIAGLTAQLGAAVTRDYAKWPVSQVLPNGRNGIVYGPSVATWEGQIEAMRTFVTARLAWMETQLQ